MGLCMQSQNISKIHYHILTVSWSNLMITFIPIIQPDHPPWSSTLIINPDVIRYVMCFSLILLSVDLSSPHVKNKMSKREFIRNTRGAVGAEGDKFLNCWLSKTFSFAVGRGLEEDLYGSLYDNIFLRGHIGWLSQSTWRVRKWKSIACSRRGAASGPGQATICSWLPRAFSLNPPRPVLSKKATWSKNSIFPESSTSQSRSKPALCIFLGNELVIPRSFSLLKYWFSSRHLCGNVAYESVWPKSTYINERRSRK